MEPNLTERPAHVDPVWWARVSWSVRRRIIDAHNRANRPAESDAPPNLAPLPMSPRGKPLPASMRAELVAQAIEAGMTAPQIVADMGIKPGSIVRALERAGRKELIADFERMRKAQIGRSAA